jgi:hypothetical protein
MKSSLFAHTARTALTALALAAAAASSHAAVESFTSGAAFFKRVITNTSVQTINTTAPSSTTFADVPSTLTTIFVPPQSTVLVSVDYNAEAACYGGGATNPNWCELMVMIGGVEGSPQASTTSLGDTYAFAATDAGAAASASWRGHAMSRHRCVRNASNAPLPVAVSVQWKIVNFSPAAAPSTTFWLDDSAMVIQMSRDCLVQPVPAAAGFGPETNGTTQSGR